MASLALNAGIPESTVQRMGVQSGQLATQSGARIPPELQTFTRLEEREKP